MLGHWRPPYAPWALAAATPVWKIIDAQGRTVAGGSFAARDIPIGKNIPLGTVTAALATLPAPAAYKLVVGLKGTAKEKDDAQRLLTDLKGS